MSRHYYSKANSTNQNWKFHTKFHKNSQTWLLISIANSKSHQKSCQNHVQNHKFHWNSKTRSGTYLFLRLKSQVWKKLVANPSKKSKTRQNRCTKNSIRKKGGSTMACRFKNLTYQKIHDAKIELHKIRPYWTKIERNAKNSLYSLLWQIQNWTSMPKTRKFETEIENHRAKLVYMTIKVTDLAQICSRITQQSPKNHWLL